MDRFDPFFPGIIRASGGNPEQMRIMKKRNRIRTGRRRAPGIQDAFSMRSGCIQRPKQKKTKQNKTQTKHSPFGRKKGGALIPARGGTSRRSSGNGARAPFPTPFSLPRGKGMGDERRGTRAYAPSPRRLSPLQRGTPVSGSLFTPLSLLFIIQQRSEGGPFRARLLHEKHPSPAKGS